MRAVKNTTCHGEISETIIRILEPCDDQVVGAFVLDPSGELRALYPSAEKYRALAESAV